MNIENGMVVGNPENDFDEGLINEPRNPCGCYKDEACNACDFQCAECGDYSADCGPEFNDGLCRSCDDAARAVEAFDKLCE